MNGCFMPSGFLKIAIFLALIPMFSTNAALAAVVGKQLWRISEGLQQPSAVAVAEDGRVFLLDGTNQLVHVYGPDGGLQKSFKALPQDTPENHLTTDIQISGNKLYIADPSGHGVIVSTLQGKILETVLLNTETGPATPTAILITRNRIYWSDRKEHRLCSQIMDRTKPVRCWGGRGRKNGEFNYPYMLAMEADDSLMVVDVLNARVQRFKWNGYYYGGYGRFGGGEYELYRPNGIAIDNNAMTYITDTYRGAIALFRNFRPLGDLRDPAGNVWRFKAPVGIALWRDRLYVVDTLGSTLTAIRLFDNGVATPERKDDARPGYSKKSCLICHLSWSPDYRADEMDESVLPVASARMCYGCHHGAVIESRLRIGQGHQHPSLPQEQKESAKKKSGGDKNEIPKAFPLVKDERLYCGSCHTPHIKPDKGEPSRKNYSNSWLRQPNQGAGLCRQCHKAYATGWKDTAAADAKKNHPIDISMRPPPSKAAKGYPQDRELQDGYPKPLQQAGGRLTPEEQVMCQSCHQIHGAPASALLILNNDTGGLCTSCHRRLQSKDKEEARRKGIHPINIKLEEPVKINGKEITRISCGSCHYPHAAEPGTALLPPGLNRDSLCQGCHEQQHAENEKESRKKGIHPINVELEKPVRLAGKEIKRLKCLSCHDIHGGIADTPALAADHRDGSLCKACHKRHYAPDDKEARKKGVHPINTELEKPVKLAEKEIKKLTCISCHSTHKGKADTPALVAASDDGEICRTCHEQQDAKDLDDARKKGVHPVNMTLKEAVNIADMEVKKITCLSCHKLHKGEPGTPATVVEHRDGTLCRTCHDAQMGVAWTDHDLAQTLPVKTNSLEQSHEQAGLCGSCHSMHRNKEKHRFLFVGSMEKSITGSSTATARDGLCLACHRENGYAKDKMVEQASHPYKDMVMRSPVDDLPLLGGDDKVSEFGRIGCITCHDPHRWSVAPGGAALSDENASPAYWTFGCIDSRSYAPSHCSPWGMLPGLQPFDLRLDPALISRGWDKEYIFKPDGNTGGREGTVLTSFLRRRGIGGSFCVDCHGLEARVKYKYFHDERGREKGLDYIE
ncbi:MAG TPA: hypothetical protein ENI99_12650 [Sedimenticola sp.]|nr:hypothetical protein [Sedimenticola sp.]